MTQGWGILGSVRVPFAQTRFCGPSILAGIVYKCKLHRVRRPSTQKIRFSVLTENGFNFSERRFLRRKRNFMRWKRAGGRNFHLLCRIVQEIKGAQNLGRRSEMKNDFYANIVSPSRVITRVKRKYMLIRSLYQVFGQKFSIGCHVATLRSRVTLRCGSRLHAFSKYAHQFLGYHSLFLNQEFR